MENIITIAEVIVPILVAVLLGIIARQKKTADTGRKPGSSAICDQIRSSPRDFQLLPGRGYRRGVCQFHASGNPLLHHVLPLVLLRPKKALPYYNLPMLFSAQETGMLGILLFMILFGVDQAYRMGVLDLAQAVTAYPTIAILTSAGSESPSLRGILKKIVTSPLLIMCALGLTLNLTGAADWLDSVGIKGIITESTGFMAQPISAMMIFSVGYNFSLD